jgi:hypothetical protein
LDVPLLDGVMGLDQTLFQVLDLALALLRLHREGLNAL